MLKFRNSIILILSLVSAVAVPLSAQVVRQLTRLDADSIGAYALNDAGTLVVAAWSADPFGTNALHAPQAVKWTLPGAAAAQVGSFSRGVVAVSIRDDGTNVAVVSTADPLGTNHDGSAELFLMNLDGTGVTQLTSDPAVNAGAVKGAMISGSGNRVVFQANTDPLGTNAAHRDQLFVITLATSGIVQLTSATSGSLNGFSITDDGTKIVFAHTGDLTGANPTHHGRIFKIANDGTGLTQLTVPITATVDYGSPTVSGLGSQIAFSDVSSTVYTMKYAGGAVTTVAAGDADDAVSLSDDGRFLYVARRDPVDSNFEIWVYNTVTSAFTQLTFTSPFQGNYAPVVSGGNTRVAFITRDGTFGGGSNPDGGAELVVMDANGSNAQQLTTSGVSQVSRSEPDITLDGSRVVLSTQHPFPPANSTFDLARVQADGSQLTQLTTNAGALHPSITADGQSIVFMSYDDLTGASCANPQIYRVLADGTGLIRVDASVPCDYLDHPVVSRNGAATVFQSFAGPSPGSLRTAPPSGGASALVVADSDFLRKHPRVTADGVWTVFCSTTDVDGLNPDRLFEIWRARVDGSALERITLAAGFNSQLPDISGDGVRIVYESNADFVGTNADHNYEIFLRDTVAATTIQLTHTTAGDSFDARISEDGAWVYFYSTAGWFETLPGSPVDFYRMALASGTIERVAGLRPVLSRSAYRNNPDLATDGDGDRAVFVGAGDPNELNHDGTYELWIADQSTPAQIRPGKGAPTLVTWDVEPKPVRYDVIRGDVDNLQSGGAGSVDLGPVVCIENDSPDATTAGFEDVTQPTSGHAFFYLYRGTQGLLDGPGSWGRGTGGERSPASGGCAP
ncbi:MAG TPA: hypothetical protein VJS92_18145 [Candidatus Polarisedimenticolaceae bacterium]|nr:hypothetical protein [Candidatus Polarisedimenticolaceae bacterium]